MGQAAKKQSVSDQQTNDIIQVLSAWMPNAPQEYLSGARWSLETVTRLTEYEDEKANRILTAMAFLSALVGVVFAVAVQKCPASLILQLGTRGYHWSAVGLTAMYALFLIYFLLLAAGAIFTICAVKPTFNIPKTWQPQKGAPASLLFYAKIVEVTGKEWANAFVQRSATDVDRQYLRNAILETYLIAHKIRLKYQRLRWGIGLFIISTILLVLLLPLSAIVIARVDTILPEKTTLVQRASTEPGIALNRGAQSSVPGVWVDKGSNKRQREVHK